MRIVTGLLAVLSCLHAQQPAAPPARPPAPPATPQAAAAPRHPPTFTQDVAPIVWQSCAGCHRPGEVAPFPLLSYQDVKKKGKTIRSVVDDRFMPPWHPEPRYGTFRNSMRLTDAAVQTISDWVEAGMPEGPKDALPPLPKFTEGWQLGEPDLVVKMPKGFDVAAAGRDVYRNFAISIDQPEDRWITAIEVRPSARAVLHHVLIFLDDSGDGRRLDGQDGRAGYSGMRLNRTMMIGGWAVGGMPEHLPEGLAIKLPKGQDLILQSHFHPSGKKETEQTTIGFHFAKQPPSRTLVPIQLPPFFGVAAGIDIAPGDKNWRLEDTFTLPCAVDAVTVGGHAHMVCHTMRLSADLADGSNEPLLFIRNWDFDWQNRYTYEPLVRLPKGAVLRAELLYDNSADNPNNPNKPPKRVHWGPQSTDEMGAITVMVTPADEKDAELLLNAVRTKMREKAFARVDQELDARLKEWDKNGDGKVSRDEVPARMRRMFDFFDRNHDGFLDKEEVKSLADGFGGLPGGGVGGTGGPGGGRGGGER